MYVAPLPLVSTLAHKQGRAEIRIAYVLEELAILASLSEWSELASRLIAG